MKKISYKEKKSLNILCRGAAMRYFLTRLYDYTNTPKTALIKIKDPREYYQKLIIQVVPPHEGSCFSGHQKRLIADTSSLQKLLRHAVLWHVH